MELKFHYRVHNGLQSDPVLSQMFQAHTFLPYFPTIHSSRKVKLSLCLTKHHAIRRIGMWRYNSRNSWPRH
jgi:hypothetical protein